MSDFFIEILLSVVIVLATVIILEITKILLSSIFKKLLSKIFCSVEFLTIDENFFRAIVKTLFFPLYFSIPYIFFKSLEIFKDYQNILRVFVIVIFVFSLLRLFSLVINHVLKNHFKDRISLKNIGALSTLINIVLWVVGSIIMLDNFGIRVSAILTGLGIGGVAVALAAQRILGDLFSYFAIFLDKPFEEGDFIVVGDVKGTVEHIGLKTTRLRSFTGEQIIFSNSELTNAVVRNFKKMIGRRAIFQIGVFYDTPTEKLKLIPTLIKQVIEQIPLVTFERTHLVSFESSSFNFEIVYFVNNPDHNTFLDIQQKINFSLKEEFEKNGIKFVFSAKK